MEVRDNCKYFLNFDPFLLMCITLNYFIMLFTELLAFYFYLRHLLNYFTSTCEIFGTGVIWTAYKEVKIAIKLIFGKLKTKLLF